MTRVPGGFGVSRPDRSVSMRFEPQGQPMGAGAGGAGTGFGARELMEAVQMLMADYQERRAAQGAGERKHTYGPDSDPFSEAVGGGLNAVGRGVGAVGRAGERIGETMQDWERNFGEALFRAMGGAGDAVGSATDAGKDMLMSMIRDYSRRRNEQHRGERRYTYG